LLRCPPPPFYEGWRTTPSLLMCGLNDVLRVGTSYHEAPTVPGTGSEGIIESITVSGSDRESMQTITGLSRGEVGCLTRTN
jgi:hypothetical protein